MQRFQTQPNYNLKPSISSLPRFSQCNEAFKRYALYVQRFHRVAHSHPDSHPQNPSPNIHQLLSPNTYQALASPLLRFSQCKQMFEPPFVEKPYLTFILCKILLIDSCDPDFMGNLLGTDFFPHVRHILINNHICDKHSIIYSFATHINQDNKCQSLKTFMTRSKRTIPKIFVVNDHYQQFCKKNTFVHWDMGPIFVKPKQLVSNRPNHPILIFPKVHPISHTDYQNIVNEIPVNDFKVVK